MKKYNSIEEVKIVPKKKIGSGMEHDVYPSTNQDVVIKTPSSRFGKNKPKIKESWVKMFKEHPNMFPKILKQTENYVILEKLDTNKAMSEYLTLDGLLKEDRELWDGDFAYTLFLLHKDSDEYKLEAIDQHFENLGGKSFQLYSKWRNLILGFLDIMPHDYYSDLHVGQFGYSKDGTLKILDF